MATTSGIGSVLDVNGIVTSLMNVEKAPLTKVATQKNGISITNFSIRHPQKCIVHIPNLRKCTFKLI